MNAFWISALNALQPADPPHCWPPGIVMTLVQPMASVTKRICIARTADTDRGVGGLAGVPISFAKLGL
jgi:hypothetical protein